MISTPKVRICPFKEPTFRGGAVYNVLNGIDTSVTVGGFSYTSHPDNPNSAKFTDAELQVAIDTYEANLQRAIALVRERQEQLASLISPKVYTIQQISNTFALLDEKHTVGANADTRRQLLEKLAPDLQIREGNGNVYTVAELLATGPQPK